MRIAIIPARGGSKRIPRKNIKEFNGKPIIAYAIEAAAASGCFDRILVSSDDDEILEIAHSYAPDKVDRCGRPAKLSGDDVGTVPVLLHEIQWYRHQLSEVCCIYPCNPFLTPEKLEEGLAHHIGSESDSTFPVVQYSYPIQRSLRIIGGVWTEMRWPENYEARSQDLEPTYHDAGQFYWLNVEALKKQQKLFMAKSTPLIYPETEVQDIDTLEDWTLAEVKYQLWRNTLSLSSVQETRAPLAP